MFSFGPVFFGLWVCVWASYIFGSGSNIYLGLWVWVWVQTLDPNQTHGFFFGLMSGLIRQLACFFFYKTTFFLLRI